jgi:hypothetical protein
MAGSNGWRLLNDKAAADLRAQRQAETRGCLLSGQTKVTEAGGHAKLLLKSPLLNGPTTNTPRGVSQ